jgi:hypothetical protein
MIEMHHLKSSIANLGGPHAGTTECSIAKHRRRRWTATGDNATDCDVSLDENELERLKLGLDTLRAYNHEGTVVVASVWLALYVIMSIGHLMAPIN